MKITTNLSVYSPFLVPEDCNRISAGQPIFAIEEKFVSENDLSFLAYLEDHTLEQSKASGKDLRKIVDFVINKAEELNVYYNYPKIMLTIEDGVSTLTVTAYFTKELTREGQAYKDLSKVQ